MMTGQARRAGHSVPTQVMGVQLGREAPAPTAENVAERGFLRALSSAEHEGGDHEGSVAGEGRQGQRTSGGILPSRPRQAGTGEAAPAGAVAPADDEEGEPRSICRLVNRPDEHPYGGQRGA